MNIGSRIKSAREARKMTQEELGVACGTTKQSIFKYETGIITNIPLNRIEKIAEVLGVSPAYLMGWDDYTYCYPPDEMIDLYAKGAAKWANDFRFSEKQKERIYEYLIEFFFKAKSTVNLMAEAKNVDGKILLNHALQSILDESARWVHNAVNYVNEDFQSSNLEDELLDCFRNLSDRDKIAWLTRIEDYISEQRNSLTSQE